MLFHCVFIFCISVSTVLLGKELKIVTTTTILKDITQNIVANNSTVQSLLPPGADPHTYEAVPGDMEKIAQADIIIKNGMNLEGWLGKLLSNKSDKAIIIDASQSIEPLRSTLHANAVDPHVWMSPLNVKIQTRNIFETLIIIDKANEKIYAERFKQYVQKLDELHAYILEKTRLIPEGKRILISSHDAFEYFGKQYNIEPEGILGISTDADVQTADILRVRSLIQQHSIKTIFVESSVNPKLIQQIAGDLQIQVGEQLYTDSLGDSISVANTYINMLKHNADAIVKGLTASESKEMRANSSFHYLLWIVIVAMISMYIYVVKNIKTKVK